MGGCSHGVWGSTWRRAGQGPGVPPDPLPDRPPRSLLPGRAPGVRAATGLHLCVPAEGAPTAHLAPVRAQGGLGSLPQGCCDWDPPARGCVCVLSSHGLLCPRGKVTTWGPAGDLREALGLTRDPVTDSGDPSMDQRPWY